MWRRLETRAARLPISISPPQVTISQLSIVLQLDILQCLEGRKGSSLRQTLQVSGDREIFIIPLYYLALTIFLLKTKHVFHAFNKNGRNLLSKIESFFS